jgi:hypothetical protein
MSTKKAVKAKKKDGDFKATTAQVAGAMQNLSHLSVIDLPPIAAMWVRSAVRVFMPIFEDFQKEREVLIDRHCETMNDGTRKETKDGEVVYKDQDAFDDEFEALISVEHPIICKPLSVNALQPKNPQREILLKAIEIAFLEELGLLVE